MLRYRLLHLSLLWLVGLALPARAGSPLSAPVMLQDIRPGTTDELRAVGELSVSADTVYFSHASHNNQYNVLWRSDGTPEGTFPLGDRFPSGYAVKPFLFGSHSFFLAEDESRLSLWKTDGTRAGTVVVYGGSSPRSGSGGFSPVVMGDAFYFAAALDETGVELWKSDGTPTGTVRVKDLLPGPGSSNPQQLTVMGSELFFLTDTPTGSIRWKSDGTPEGTVVLEEQQTWSTEGTAAGTLVTAALPGCDAERDAELNGQCFYLSSGYYRVPNRDYYYVELKVLDLSGQGDRLVYTINEPSQFSLSYSNFAVLGGELFFVVAHMNGGELWASDGTTAGTRKVSEFSMSFFSTSRLEVARGKLFFTVSGMYRPTELWTSDGTTEGTRQVRHEAAPLGSQLEPMAQVGSTFLFAEWDAYGMEPWRTDGTGAGTVLVKDLQPGSPVTRPPPLFTYPFSPASVRVGSTVYFLAKDDVQQQLWKSDGTEAGTVLIKDISTLGTYWAGVSWDWLQAVGSTVYFMANAGHGMELWKSDGTEAGTVLVKDINPGAASGLPWSHAGSPSPRSKPLAVGGALLFIADDGVHGWELWKSDGTEAGTVLVKDIRPGVEGSNGDWLPESILGDVLYFFADDGVHGRELWRSDGTEAGTWLVGDLTPGEAGSASPLPPTAANGALYFSMLDATGGLAVWKSDGTGEGTHLLKLLQAGPFDMPSLPAAAFFTAVKDQVFFVGFDSAHGYELWKTDGTGTGTLRVTDLNPGPASATPPKSFSLLALEDHGLLLFAASDGVHGVEPWVTDGTEAGTSLVADLSSGASSSLAGGFRRFGDHVFFSADDGVHGQEPWSLALEPLSVTPEEPKTGCGGCQSVGAPGTLALWALVMMLAGLGPRRRTR